MNELEMQTKLVVAKEFQRLRRMEKIARNGFIGTLIFLIIWILLPIVGLIKLV